MQVNQSDSTKAWEHQSLQQSRRGSVGYTPAGKRIVKKASGRTKTEAKAKLKEIIRDYDDGLAIAPANYTVADAVKYWLQHGLAGRSATTVKMYTTYADKHVIPARWVRASCVTCRWRTSTGGWRARRTS
ncbi:hypothetical protein [Streptosporangium sp. NPDC002607]